MNQNQINDIVFELEEELIPPDKWTDEVLSNFPEDVRNNLVNGTGGGPMGIGYREDVGWFCLGTGQGPFVIWAENMNYE